MYLGQAQIAFNGMSIQKRGEIVTELKKKIGIVDTGGLEQVDIKLGKFII